MQVLLTYMNNIIWRHKCVVRALARFSDRHVTRFRPIASTHFQMRYNNTIIIINFPWHRYTNSWKPILLELSEKCRRSMEQNLIICVR